MKESQKEKAYRKIKSDIKKGVLRGNDKIAEEKYATITGVSRTPLREAVRLLEMEGLLYSKTNVGVFVNEITNQDVLEIFEIKSAIEPIIYSKAFVNINEEELKKLELIIKNAHLDFDNKRYDNLADIAKNFYVVLYTSAKSPHCVNVLKRLSSIQEVIRFRALDSKVEELHGTIKEYEAILLGLKNNDLAEYENAYKKHLEKARARYLLTI